MIVGLTGVAFEIMDRVAAELAPWNNTLYRRLAGGMFAHPSGTLGFEPAVSIRRGTRIGPTDPRAMAL
jgi:hypothetical protein